MNNFESVKSEIWRQVRYGMWDHMWVCAEPTIWEHVAEEVLGKGEYISLMRNQIWDAVK